MPIKITINGVNALKDELRSIPKNLEASVLRQMSQIAYEQMQDGATRHNRSGALFASVYNRSTGQGADREVGHDPQRASYAPFVVFGTRPHIIQPSKKKALRWAGNGRFYFAKWVKHPGYVGDDYVTRAADEAIRQFSAIVDQAIKDQSTPKGST